MNKTPAVVPILEPREVFRKNLGIPLRLYFRMIEEEGLHRGEVNQFIIDAIKEKLDRDAAHRAANKE